MQQGKPWTLFSIMRQWFRSVFCLAFLHHVDNSLLQRSRCWRYHFEGCGRIRMNYSLCGTFDMVFVAGHLFSPHPGVQRVYLPGRSSWHCTFGPRVRMLVFSVFLLLFEVSRVRFDHCKSQTWTLMRNLALTTVQQPKAGGEAVQWSPRAVSKDICEYFCGLMGP